MPTTQDRNSKMKIIVKAGKGIQSDGGAVKRDLKEFQPNQNL